MISLAVIVAVIGVVLFVTLRPRPEGPIYKGRHLSEWVESLGTHTPGSPTWTVARDAVRAIGADAYPYLLKWLPHEEKNWRLHIVEKINPMAYQVDDVSAAWSRAEKRANGVGAAIFAIYSNPGPEVIEDLSRLTNNPVTPRTSRRAMDILDTIARYSVTSSVPETSPK